MSLGVTPSAVAILTIAVYDGLSFMPENTMDKVLMGRPDRWITSAIVRLWDLRILVSASNSSKIITSFSFLIITLREQKVDMQFPYLEFFFENSIDKFHTRKYNQVTNSK